VVSASRIFNLNGNTSPDAVSYAQNTIVKVAVVIGVLARKRAEPAETPFALLTVPSRSVPAAGRRAH
jgi:hypothetical protein